MTTNVANLKVPSVQKSAPRRQTRVMLLVYGGLALLLSLVVTPTVYAMLRRESRIGAGSS